jgi:hypothetical protein
LICSAETMEKLVVATIRFLEQRKKNKSQIPTHPRFIIDDTLSASICGYRWYLLRRWLSLKITPHASVQNYF